MKVLFFLLMLVILAVLLRPVYHEPLVYPGLISSQTCEYIIKKASEHLEPSSISRDKVIDEHVRKSKTAWLRPEDDDTIKEVMEKCLAHTDKTLENCEYLQVLKYTPSGFYKPHQDAFVNDPNMRVYTCVIALTDEFQGGETEFPNLRKRFKLKKGDMLFFNTLDSWGRITPKALHGGRPVITGEKWICNLWIRMDPYETSIALNTS